MEIFEYTVLANKYIPHEPTEKQALFLLSLDEEVFYGGAAGGGKTNSLLMAALQYVEIPTYSALILRRTYSDLALPDAIMDRCYKWLFGTDAIWLNYKKTWVFPSGATLTFGHLDKPNDKYRYQGSAYQAIFFDELSQFGELEYLYLYSRLRRQKKLLIPLRMWSTGNPGGRGHLWVKNRFVMGSKKYIPATLKDNPFLDQASYRKSLMNLDPITREQLLNGDWDVCIEGNLFKREWFQIIHSYPSDCQKVRYWDFAATEGGGDWTAGSLLGEKDGVVYILDIQHLQGSPKRVEDRLLQIAELDGPNIPIRWEEEGGSSGKMVSDHLIKKLMGYDAKGVRSTGSKISRAGPLSSYAEAGNVKLFRGDWNPDFLEELTLFPAGANDDIVDSVSGAFTQLSISVRSPYEPTIDDAIGESVEIPGCIEPDTPGMW